jgi:hypothetical protein
MLKGPKKASAESEVRAVAPATAAASRKRLFLVIEFLLTDVRNLGRDHPRAHNKNIMSGEGTGFDINQ